MAETSNIAVFASALPYENNKFENYMPNAWPERTPLLSWITRAFSTSFLQTSPSSAALKAMKNVLDQTKRGDEGRDLSDVPMLQQEVGVGYFYNENTWTVRLFHLLKACFPKVSFSCPLTTGVPAKSAIVAEHTKLQDVDVGRVSIQRDSWPFCIEEVDSFDVLEDAPDTTKTWASHRVFTRLRHVP